jgi:hypothetical protein
MSGTAKVIQPQGSFTSSQGSAAASGAISAELDEFAAATAEIFPRASGSSTIPYDKLAQMLGTAQTRSLQQANGQFTGSISGGSSGAVSFAGFEVLPALQLATGYFGPTVQALHQTAVIQRLNMLLYITSMPDLGQISEPDIPTRIQTIVKAIVDRWRTVTYPSMTSFDQQVAIAIHEANTPGLQALYNILGNSDDFTIDGLEALAEQVPMVNQKINDFIFQTLCDSKDNFWPSFLFLIQSFGMRYAPAFGDASEVGRLIGIQEAFDAVEDKTDLSMLQLSETLQEPVAPITHVVIPKLPTAGPHRAYTQQNSNLLPGQAVAAMVRYPSGQYTGRGHILQPPPWLSVVFQSLSTTAVLGNTLQEGQIHSTIEQLTTQTAAAMQAFKTFLTGMAKRVFHLLALQNAMATVTLPFDGSWEVGTAYKVGLNGTSLFTGLCASVRHSTSSHQSSPQHFTTVGFSHVQWSGFTFNYDS